MALMLGTLYDAMRNAGVSPELARAAAEEVYTQRLMSPDDPRGVGNLDLQGAVRILQIKVNFLAGFSLFLLLLFTLAAGN